jgi:hypothetical protein
MDIRHGKPVDPDVEAALLRDFSALISTSANEALPDIKALILEKMDDWKLGALPAHKLLCEIEQRLRHGPGMSRVMADGSLVPLNLIGGK